MRRARLAAGVLAVAAAVSGGAVVAAGTGAGTASCTPSPVLTPTSGGDTFSVTCSVPRSTVTRTVTVTGTTTPVFSSSTTTTTASPTSTATAWPGPANTGVPAGTTLTRSGDVLVTTAGAVVDKLDIRGTLQIRADNVTVRRTRVTGSAYALIRVADTAKGVVLEDVTIDGMGSGGTSNSGGIIGPARVVRANISGVENGVVPGSGSVITDSWIHDLGAPGNPHIDGVQIDGGVSEITVERNFVDMSEWGQTSTVMVDNYFGPADAIMVRGNRLLGGGYTVYSDGQFAGGPVTRVSFVGNRLGRGGWGYAVVRNNTPSWSGNVDDVTGATIPAP